MGVATDPKYGVHMYADPAVGAEQIGHAGQVALWFAFCGLFIPCMYMAMSALHQPDGKRYFHTLCFLINAIASVAYLVMATGYGNCFVYGSDGKFRQFFFARYIDWALTTPLMLLDLAGLAGASSDTVIWLLSTDFLMIICGLIGGLIGSNSHVAWGFWAFGMAAFVPIVYFLHTMGATCPESTKGIYKSASLLTIIFWSIYPIVWILAEGTGILSSDAEVICYTILDIVAKSVFGILIISARDSLAANYDTPIASTPLK